MSIKLARARVLREMAARLIKQAEELEAGIDRSKCKHGEYINIPFNGCKSCGKTYRVKCSKKNYGFVNSGKCKPGICPDFTAPVSLTVTRNT